MAHPGVHAASRPDAPAFIMATTGETTTWAQLRQRSVAAANRLHDLGLRAGDSVAFCIENRPDFGVLVWACHDAGYRYTPISTRLTPEEVAYIVDDCGASVFLHSEQTAQASAGVDALDSVRHVVDLDDPMALGDARDTVDELLKHF